MHWWSAVVQVRPQRPWRAAASGANWCDPTPLPACKTAVFFFGRVAPGRGAQDGANRLRRPSQQRVMADRHRLATASARRPLPRRADGHRVGPLPTESHRERVCTRAGAATAPPVPAHPRRKPLGHWRHRKSAAGPWGAPLARTRQPRLHHKRRALLVDLDRKRRAHLSAQRARSRASLQKDCHTATGACATAPTTPRTRAPSLADPVCER